LIVAILSGANVSNGLIRGSRSVIPEPQMPEILKTQDNAVERNTFAPIARTGKIQFGLLTRNPLIGQQFFRRFILPRRRRPASYSCQFVTLNFILVIRCRREALCLCGMLDQSTYFRSRPHRCKTLKFDPCTNSFRMSTQRR